MMSAGMGFKAGFVALLGRPNTGKSTLVNRLVGQKVAIVSPRPQTTRNRIQGIVNRPGAQVILIDTPGLHRPTSVLGRQMMEEVEMALDGIDLLAVLLDASEPLTTEDRAALDRAHRFHRQCLVLPNKIDLIAKPKLLPLIDTLAREYGFAEIIPISALTGDGLPRFLEQVIAHLPEGQPYFPDDLFTDQPERFLAGELLREKVLTFTRQEVPHAVAVLVDSFEEGPRLVRIRATIYVEREGQKGIIIGRGGDMLKRIGAAARKEMEDLLGVKVFLETYVKVQRNWRQRPALVRQLDWRRQLTQLAGSSSGPKP